jgi:hypothetical protein
MKRGGLWTGVTKGFGIIGSAMLLGDDMFKVERQVVGVVSCSQQYSQ